MKQFSGLSLGGFSLKSCLICVILSGPGAAWSQQQTPPPAVVVAAATLENVQDAATFTGRLVAAQHVDIRARATGFIETIDFTEGGTIEAGAMLYQIEDDTYAAALREIEGQLISAQAERDLAELERDRQEELVKRQATPQRNLDQAIAALGQTEGALVTLEAQKRAAELNLSYTRITAPFAGIVGLTQYDVGALVGPDSGRLVTLTQSDPIYAEFSVPTRVFLNYQTAIASGAASGEGTISLTQADGTINPGKGTVDYVDSLVAQGTDTILVRATFDNPDNALRDGEFVVVTLQESRGDQVLTIPSQAISRDLTGSFVMVVADDGTVSQRQIDTGQSQRGMTTVRGGLQEGELVITEGLNKVRPGIKVDAAPAGQTTPTAQD